MRGCWSAARHNPFTRDDVIAPFKFRLVVADLVQAVDQTDHLAFGPIDQIDDPFRGQYRGDLSDDSTMGMADLAVTVDVLRLVPRQTANEPPQRSSTVEPATGMYEPDPSVDKPAPAKHQQVRHIESRTMVQPNGKNASPPALHQQIRTNCGQCHRAPQGPLTTSVNAFGWNARIALEDGLRLAYDDFLLL